MPTLSAPQGVSVEIQACLRLSRTVLLLEVLVVVVAILNSHGTTLPHLSNPAALRWALATFANWQDQTPT